MSLPKLLPSPQEIQDRVNESLSETFDSLIEDLSVHLEEMKENSISFNVQGIDSLVINKIIFELKSAGWKVELFQGPPQDPCHEIIISMPPTVLVWGQNL